MEKVGFVFGLFTPPSDVDRRRRRNWPHMAQRRTSPEADDDAVLFLNIQGVAFVFLRAILYLYVSAYYSTNNAGHLNSKIPALQCLLSLSCPNLVPEQQSEFEKKPYH